MILSTPLKFHTTAYIDSIWAYTSHCLGNIIWRQTTGKDNSAKLFRLYSNIPIKYLAGTTKETVCKCIKEKGRDNPSVVNQRSKTLQSLHTHSLYGSSHK